MLTRALCLNVVLLCAWCCIGEWSSAWLSLRAKLRFPGSLPEVFCIRPIPLFFPTPVARAGSAQDKPFCPTAGCPSTYRPVCGSNGVSYDNDCVAICAGAKVASVGICSTPAPVAAPPSEWANLSLPGRRAATGCHRCLARNWPPGGQGLALAGSVERALHAFDLTVRGPTAAPSLRCACLTLYEPVCGTNGRTFTNKCMAECYKTEVAYAGECSLASGAGPVTKPPSEPPSEWANLSVPGRRAATGCHRLLQR